MRNTVPPHNQRGLTLVEVAVAIAILAVIYAISSQSMSISMASSEVGERNAKRLDDIEQAWFYLHQDLRNFIYYRVERSRGLAPLLPLDVNQDQEEWLTLLRAGNPNPVGKLRTNMLRVQYALIDDTLVRRTWQDLATLEEDYHVEQKLLGNIERVEVRVLPPDAGNLKVNWPTRWNQPSSLPLAIEVTLVLPDRGELKRLFSIHEAQ